MRKVGVEIAAAFERRYQKRVRVKEPGFGAQLDPDIAHLPWEGKNEES